MTKRESELYEIDTAIDDDFQTQIAPDLLRTAAIATLRHAGVTTAGMTIVVTDDTAVQTLNRAYRMVDAPTDVLSFAAREGAQMADVPPDLAEEMGDYLGDLVIALPYATAQAQRYGNAIDAEIRMLVVHGTLHLLGYDHDTPERQREMWERQRAVTRELGDDDTDWEREHDA